MKFYIVTLNVLNLKDLANDREVYVTYTGIPSDEVYEKYRKDNEGKIIIVYRDTKDHVCQNLCGRGIDAGSASALVSRYDIDTPEGREGIAVAIRKRWGVEWLEV